MTPRDELRAAIESDLAYLVQKIGRFQQTAQRGDDAESRCAYLMLQSSIEQLANTLSTALLSPHEGARDE